MGETYVDSQHPRRRQRRKPRRQEAARDARGHAKEGDGQDRCHARTMAGRDRRQIQESTTANHCRTRARGRPV